MDDIRSLVHRLYAKLEEGYHLGREAQSQLRLVRKKGFTSTDIPDEMYANLRRLDEIFHEFFKNPGLEWMGIKLSALFTWDSSLNYSYAVKTGILDKLNGHYFHKRYSKL